MSPVQIIQLFAAILIVVLAVPYMTVTIITAVHPKGQIRTSDFFVRSLVAAVGIFGAVLLFQGALS